MKKEDLLAKLRTNTQETFDMPDISVRGIEYPDPYKKFVEATREVGAQVVEVRKTDDLNAVIRNIYPNAKVYASNLPFITLAQRNPDIVAAADLDDTDVGIVQGQIGVAENACVWVPQTMKEKAVCFIAEYLIILLDKQNIVNNMHEAYKRIQMDPRYNFGTFISGPSKTADIEQALVMGAQAARGVTVLSME